MLEEQQSFAYVNGRCMKVTFQGNTLHEHEYDLANRAPWATNLAASVVGRLRDADKCLRGERLGAGRAALTWVRTPASPGPTPRSIRGWVAPR
jgi:hypothetical protein